ncbi:MAG TPA: hypothetical protein VLI71_17180 [Gammaproteobacteria bacterium]|nr:hypothetical protein [Gammaproteobacteria bacterium]
MKRLLLLSAALVASSGASAQYAPAEERGFAEFASRGCNNREGDFIIRGMVSSANEDTLVLSDPADSSRTMSVTLPGRGPFARARGVFGESKHELTDQRLNEMRASGTPVVVTLKCQGDGTPIAQEISYTNLDGTRAAISF